MPPFGAESNFDMEMTDKLGDFFMVPPASYYSAHFLALFKLFIRVYFLYMCMVVVGLRM